MICTNPDHWPSIQKASEMLAQRILRAQLAEQFERYEKRAA